MKKQNKKKLQSWMGINVLVETPNQAAITGTVVSQITTLTIKVNNPPPGQPEYLQSVPTQLVKIIPNPNPGGEQ